MCDGVIDYDKLMGFLLQWLCNVRVGVVDLFILNGK